MSFGPQSNGVTFEIFDDKPSKRGLVQALELLQTLLCYAH